MKKGEISLSFGMIFSIIIIVAVIATAFYALTYFLKLKSCSEIGLYARDLQDNVDDAWNSDTTQKTFSAGLPSKVEKICIGDISQGKGREEYETLKRYEGEDKNFFIYPIPSSCELRSFKIEHAIFSGFSCIEVKGGKASLRLEKDSFDNLVLVRPVS